MLTQLFLRVAFVGSEWVLWVLLAINFISVATIVDRILYLRRTKVDGEALGVKLDQFLRAGDLRGAWTLVSESEAIECIVVAAGLAALSRGAQACGEAMLSAKARVKPLLEARLNILGTIGSNAPYVGLLGTVLGIIKAAHDLTAQGEGATPNAVMAGVFEALIATAFGLFVAIPAVIAFNVFQRKVRETLAQTDSLSHQVLASIRYDRKPASQSAPQPARP
ncbi:MAG TPA: MotA/TolQ/ExbB proton channel family protein [Pirellulales bacterium]|jgi:biopolymer transport protein ExbB/TolQ|nr:MotA/TolQ/ExbB proton channel family protein [Pirellulales bacterium]